MVQYTLDMAVLHRFLGTTRTYLGMPRTAGKSPQLLERHDRARRLAGSVSELPAFQKTGYRENVPA